MDNWQPSLPYLVLAVICGSASVAIVFLAMMVLGQNGGHISDGGMFGIAAMAAAPAVMGIGIASYLPRDHTLIGCASVSTSVTYSGSPCWPPYWLLGGWIIRG